jgi:hypothetical protein
MHKAKVGLSVLLMSVLVLTSACKIGGGESDHAREHMTDLKGEIKEADVHMPVEPSMDSPLNETVSTHYDAWNPRSREDNPGGWNEVYNRPYESYRGPDQLIIYDSNYGATTGTNAWGFEVTVDADGTVTALGGNNSAIPLGGYVLSGHGLKAEWLQKHARIGASVQWNRDKKELILKFTPKSYLVLARKTVEAAERGLQESRGKFMDVPYTDIDSAIAALKEKYEVLKREAENGDFSAVQRYADEIAELGDQVFFMNFESVKTELRGIWVRPLEVNIEQVKERVANIHAANLNVIYLETWWVGYTIFPTDTPETRQNPIYRGFDVLRAYLDEAHRYGIEVHAWVEHFFVGKELVEKHPEWSIRSRKGDNFESVEGNKFYWLNPALPEARDFVADIYREMAQKYDIDGLHLDYTRYPEAGDYTNDFGYDDYTRERFQEQYGADPIRLYPGDDLWPAWVDFKVNIINTFVYRIVDELKALRPDAKISAAVWADFPMAPEYKNQKASDWIDRNLIDHVLPMSYTFGVDPVLADTREALAIAKNNAYAAIGLGPYMRIDKRTLALQVDGARRLGAAGSAMFEYLGFFNNHYDRLLKLGLFREAAVIPDRDPVKSLSLVLTEMKRKINDIYVPFQGMPADSRYADKIDAALDVLRPGTVDPGNLSDFRHRLQRLLENVMADSELHVEVKQRMKHDLEYAMRIADISMSKVNR